MRLTLIIALSAFQLWAGLHFGVGRAIRSQAQELSAEVGPSRDPQLGRPYQNAGDVTIARGYSNTASAPWGAAHHGLDFLVSTGTRHVFLAAEEGWVTEIKKFANEITGNWQVNVKIQFNKNFSMRYAFEPFTANSADADAQIANLNISKGQKVLKGESIGRLVAVGSGTHVDFGFKKKDSDVCPSGYFAPDVLNEITTSLRTVYPGANLCYE
ncbi:MAG: M23 family metallopeptidase [Elusimicrobia bacterium]|nr:M23 family metallopeptidase [Elusimicrobiota bacterium]